MYLSLSITTVPEPLSACLIIMSVLRESRLRAVRSSLVRLSAIFVGLMLDRSCSMLLMYVSSEGSMFFCGVQLLFLRYLYCQVACLCLVEVCHGRKVSVEVCEKIRSCQLVFRSS